MLTSLEIENFKGIGRAVRIDLRPITLLFGPNSSGKSSILHAFHYAREVLERGNVDADATLAGGRLLDLGGFETAVHGRDLSREIRMRFDIRNDQRGWPRRVLHAAVETGDPLFDETAHDGLEYQFRDGWIEFAVRWSHLRPGPYVSEFAISADERIVCRITSNPTGTQIRLEDIDLLHPLMTYDALEATDEDRSAAESITNAGQQPGPIAMPCDTGTRSALPSWNMSLSMPDWKLLPVLPDHPLAFQAIATGSAINEDGTVSVGRSEDPPEWNSNLPDRIDLLITGMGQLVLEELRSMTYLGPLRTLPDRNYTAPRSPNPARWADGLAAWDVLFRGDRAFAEDVGEWLGRLGTGYNLRLDEFKEVRNDSLIWRFLASEGSVEWLDAMEDLQSSFRQLRDHRRLLLIDSNTQLAVQPMDVGVGISQVVPVVVAALMKGSGAEKPLVVMEQPELHVHPAIQVELGDLFATRAGEGHGILLIETHSEHLMLRLCRRIEETGAGEVPPGKPELKPDQVAVFYVESKSGEVHAERIRIDESGEFIDRWPRGFFEERAEELF